MSNEVVAIVPSAGRGLRMAKASARFFDKGSPREKPYILLDGKPVIIRTLEALSGSHLIKNIVLVVNPDRVKYASSLIRRFKLAKISCVIAGGKMRTDSVRNGLSAAGKAKYILIHDGARPFIKNRLIADCIKKAYASGAAICALPVTPTIKKVNEKKEVVSTLARGELWEVQTPQVFRKDLIESAYKKAEKNKLCATDDAALVERAGGKVCVVKGDHKNIKITVPEDLIFAQAILKYSNE